MILNPYNFPVYKIQVLVDGYWNDLDIHTMTLVTLYKDGTLFYELDDIIRSTFESICKNVEFENVKIVKYNLLEETVLIKDEEELEI